jgi:hypothetical protein
MPLMETPAPSPRPRPSPTTPVTSPSYNGVVNNTSQTPVSSLSVYVTGSAWSVTYYKQLLNKDNEGAAFDVNREAPYQQYMKINNLEVMVTSPLSRSQDSESEIFEVTGTATCYGFMVPNPGDTFIATVDNGYQAIFNVKSVEKATYLKGSNYVITYSLTSYVDPVLVGNLDKKAIQVFQFVKSLLQQGQNPLMSADQYALYGGLNQLYGDLVSLYFRDFFSVERQTLLIPDQCFEAYDPWIVRALVDIVETDDLPVTQQRLKMPTVQGDRAMENVTVWDALLRSSRSYLMTGIQQVGLVWVQHFRNWANLGGVAFTGLDMILYPRDPRTDVDAGYEGRWCTQPQLKEYCHDGKMRYASLERVLRTVDLGLFDAACQCVEGSPAPPQAVPDIVPVTTDEYYVFTKAFYAVRGTTYASQLEILAAAAINSQALDLSTLSRLGNNAFNWPNLERFYYIPVLLALIKIALLSNNTSASS